MKILLSPAITLFSTIVTAIFLGHPTFVYSQNGTEYQSCSITFNCGNITNIGYPFWGSNRPDYCGHPKFVLNCTDETADIEMDGLNFRVLAINSESNILKIRREEYIGDICPYPHKNTTLDWEIIRYASDTQNITMFYDCPSDTLPSNQSNTFSCNGSTGFIVTPNLRNLTINSITEPCTTKVLVQASQSAIRTLEANLRGVTGNDFLVALEQGFGIQWDANNSLCETCTVSSGVCGYNKTTSLFACYCSNGQEQPFTCGGTPTNQKPQSEETGGLSSQIKLIIGVTTATTTIIIIASLLGCYYCLTRKRGIWKKPQEHLKALEQDRNVEAFISNYHSLMPQRYSYSSITRMTNAFTDKLGQGGFGGVYRGKLSDGRLVAVKLLKGSMGNGEEFINEVASISRTSHVNVVTLLGFCFERNKRALVYEYMPNGSLDKFISYDHEGPKVRHLELKKLFEIAVGIARGLEYLHRGCNTRIVHFDIKPHNILLDEDFCPKIADFGLAKLCKGKESIVSMLGARGTIGYIAPEVFMRGYGGVSYKSDVYSFGMMILEMFAGKRIVDSGEMETNSETYFPDFVYKNLERRVIGENMYTTDEDEESVRRLTIVGLWCIQTNPIERPSMTKVIEMLEVGSIQLLQIPPKPILFSLTKPTQLSSSSVYLQSQIDEDENF